MSKLVHVGLTVCCLLQVLFAPTLQAAQFTVLASSPPLALLVRSLVPDDVSVESLLLPGADPHHAHLNPGQIKALSRADLVIWQGPRWEPSLDKPLQRISPEQQLALEGFVPFAGGHPWLGSDGAAAMGRAVSERLIATMPKQEKALLALRSQLMANLSASSSQAEHALAGDVSRQFLALHDAYQPLVEQFQLQPLGYLVDSTGSRLGARSLWRISQQLEGAASICVFTQPQYSKDLLNGLAIDDRAYLAEIDPMAGKAYSEDQQFGDYYKAMLQAMVNCLTATSQSP